MTDEDAAQEDATHDAPAPIIATTALKGLDNGEIVLELGLVMTAEDLAARKISALFRGALLTEQAEQLAQDLLKAVALQRGQPPH
jgi:hypothetical protein